jgi:hypothetical protein
MGRYEVGDQLSLTWYTFDADGNTQNCDATPTVTVTGPGVHEQAVTTTNPATGTYVSTYTPTEAGRFVFELAGVLDTVPEYGAQHKTVHDGHAEGLGGPFPHGLQSWESTVH